MEIKFDMEITKINVSDENEGGGDKGVVDDVIKKSK